jgi:AICAR transformylase/IMP cyclohydrolase PurH
MKIIKVAVAIDGAVFLGKEECVAYDRMIAAVNYFNKEFGSESGSKKYEFPVELSMKMRYGTNGNFTERKVFKPYELK